MRIIVEDTGTVIVDGATKTIAGFRGLTPTVFGAAVGATYLNDNNQFVTDLRLTDGTSGLYLGQLGTP